MNIIFVLIPLGLVFLAGAIWAFFWAVNGGQYDDLDSPPLRILKEDNEIVKSADEFEDHPSGHLTKL